LEYDLPRQDTRAATDRKKIPCCCSCAAGPENGGVIDRWLARLSFSFLVLGLVLVWEWYKLRQAGAEGARPWLYIGGAVVCMILGILGIRARHRI